MLSIPLLATSVILAVGVLAQPALAQPGLTPPGTTPVDASIREVPDAKPSVRTIHYGSHVFLADASAWVVGIASDRNGGDGSVAGPMLLLGGPLVHVLHGNMSGAGYSLLARLGMPFGGGLIGAITCHEDDGFDCLGNITGGVLVGYAGSLAVDWFYLAKTEEVIPPTGLASLRPSLKLGRTGAQAGFSLSF